MVEFSPMWSNSGKCGQIRPNVVKFGPMWSNSTQSSQVAFDHIRSNVIELIIHFKVMGESALETWGCVTWSVEINSIFLNSFQSGPIQSNLVQFSQIWSNSTQSGLNQSDFCSICKKWITLGQIRPHWAEFDHIGLNLITLARIWPYWAEFDRIESMPRHYAIISIVFIRPNPT